MKARLASFYLDYLNDYLTVDCFAEFNLMSTADAATLLALGRKYHEERTACTSSKSAPATSAPAAATLVA